MLTRCPGCSTTFRITPEQLKARQGRVRCGQCQKVFNAIETLVEATVPVGPATNARSDAALGVSPAPTYAPTPADAASATSDIVPTAAMAEVLDAQSGPPPTYPTDSQSPQASVSDAIEAPPTETEDESALETLLLEEIPARRWPWVLGATVALLGLSAQAAYHFRTEVAVLAPDAKPVMLQLCATFGCDIPLPRKADLISIETSDLHPDPANPGQLQLSASLKNRAPFGQTYPHLELTLTDTADKAVLRRVLAPVDYLPKAKAASPAFAAGGDLAVNLALEVKDAAPVGYRLYVFYP